MKIHVALFKIFRLLFLSLMYMTVLLEWRGVEMHSGLANKNILHSIEKIKTFDQIDR